MKTRIKFRFHRKCQRIALILLFLMLCMYMNNWYFPIGIEFRTVIQRISHKECRTSVPTSRHGRNSDEGTWYKVKNQIGWTNQIFSFSSFYDDRRSLGSLPVVRVISVTDLTENEAIRCLVWYEQSDKTSGLNFKEVTLERHESGAGAVVKNKLYQEFMFTCNLIDENIPKYVTLFPPKVQNVTTSMYKIPVEVPYHYDTKLELGLCLSLTYWHHDPYRLVEWLEIQRLVGVNRIVVYNNTMSPQSAAVFQYYQTHYSDFLELRQSRSFIPDPGELILHLQMSPVINDCMYRNMHRFNKVLVVDTDEMIIPYKFQKIPSLLKYIETLIKQPHPARNYAFRNAYFFFEYPTSNTSIVNLVTSTYNHHAQVSDMGYSTKSIADPLSCIIMHNHYCWQYTKLYERGDVLVEVAPGFGVNRHYKKCHLNNCNELLKTWYVDRRMEDFKTPLIKAMNRNLDKLHLNFIQVK